MRYIVYIIIALCFTTSCMAKPELPGNLYQGLLAEASGEGARGMTAVACVVRNRLAIGLPVGLCGLHRPDLQDFCDREGARQNALAKEIVREVFEDGIPDITNGATHFESIWYPRPKWSAGMKVVARIGLHVFYK